MYQLRIDGSLYLGLLRCVDDATLTEKIQEMSRLYLVTVLSHYATPDGPVVVLEIQLRGKEL